MQGSNASVYECTICAWLFEESTGGHAAGVAPGPRWEDLPQDWVCPICGAGKEAFEHHTKGETKGDLGAVEALPSDPVVIIGSGLAGYSLVREIRQRAADLPITVVTANGGEVYTKPMLSNAFSKGQAPDDLVQKSGVDFAAEQGITLLTRSRVTAINRADHTVTLVSGEVLRYGQLVLALGADPRVFPVKGAEAVGIATVNELDDYRTWRARIGEKSRILLIGAGLIGCEFANDLAGAGFDVTVVDLAPWPLGRLLPQTMGERLVEALGRLGVAFHLGRTLTRYEPAATGHKAILDDGTQIAFDHALSAVGLAPRIALATEAGIATKRGIIVDRNLRTSDDAIFALGDCAELEIGPLPFIAPLLAEAKALAATLTGQESTLALPAMPVVVKTPALPLTISPPPQGTEGDWIADPKSDQPVAEFRTAEGQAVGFVIVGAQPARKQALERQMPALLPALAPSGSTTAVTEKDKKDGEAPDIWSCDLCGWEYSPETGDPENAVPPGTPWEALPEGWVCPVCGGGKDVFVKQV